MAISNNTTGYRPGVCTSTTRPTAPFEGQMIYETDTNRVLVWDNAAWVMIADTDTPPGLELVKTQTIGNNVGSVDVSNAFSAIYDNYLITVSGGSTVSGDWGINMRLGSTNSGYYNSGYYLTYGGSGSNINAAAGANWAAMGIATTNTLYASIYINAPFLTRTTYFNCSYTYGSASGGHAANGGYLDNSNSYTSFTLFQSGSFNGGTIRVYGYRNT